MTALVLGAAALVVGALALAGVWRGGDGEATAGYAPDAKGRPPVVVLILDEFPTDDLLRVDGSIDARRFPNFARLASISTWFPNAFTVYDSTFKAVPAILDARLPAKFTKPDVRSHQPSVYHLMHRLGYEIHKVESASAVCPPRICKGSRPRRPSVLDRLKGGGRPARLHRWIGAIRHRERPGFYLHHALLPHEPWIYLPSGLPNRPYGEDPIEGINTKPSFADTDLSQHNHMRHLLQVGYTDHELGRLLARLRAHRAAEALAARRGGGPRLRLRHRRAEPPLRERLERGRGRAGAALHQGARPDARPRRRQHGAQHRRRPDDRRHARQEHLVAPRRRLGLLTGVQGARRARDDHARLQARDQDRRGRARRAARREPSALGAPVRHERVQRADLRRPVGERLPHRPQRAGARPPARPARPRRVGFDRAARARGATNAARACGRGSPTPSCSTRSRRTRRSGPRA